MSEDRRPPGPIRDRLATGAGLLIGAAMLSRVLAIGSIAVLGRLLTPVDFGVIAYALLTVELQRILSGVPFVNALIRLESIDQSHINTGFTLCFVSNLVLAALLFFGADGIAAAVGRPELGSVFAWLALVPAIESLRTPRYILMARALRFDWTAAVDVLSRIATYGMAIPLAWWLGDYRAMLAGLIAGTAASTALSHVAAPGRLGFGLSRWRDCVGFGSWTMAHRITAVLNKNLAAPVVGAALGLAQLGAFRMGSGIVLQIFDRFTQPVNRIVFAGIAVRKRSPEDLRRAYLDAQSMVFGVFLPIGLGIALCAPEFLRVLAGTQWGGAVPVLQVLAPAMAVGLLGAGARGLLNALGEVRSIFLREVLVLAFVLPAVWIGATRFGVGGAALATGLGELFGLAIVLPIIARHVGGSPFDSFRRGARSIAASVAMGLAVAGLDAAFGPATVAGLGMGEAAARLGAKAALGAAVYVTVHAGLWLLAGRPHGVETIALSMLGRIGGRLARVLKR